MFNCSVCTLTSKAGEKRGVLVTYRHRPVVFRGEERLVKEIVHERPICQICKSHLHVVGGMTEEELRNRGLKVRGELRNARKVAREELRTRCQPTKTTKDQVVVNSQHTVQAPKEQQPVYPVNKPTIFGVPVKLV